VGIMFFRTQTRRFARGVMEGDLAKRSDGTLTKRMRRTRGGTRGDNAVTKNATLRCVAGMSAAEHDLHS